MWVKRRMRFSRLLFQPSRIFCAGMSCPPADTRACSGSEFFGRCLEQTLGRLLLVRWLHLFENVSVFCLELVENIVLRARHPFVLIDRKENGAWQNP
jgi:hypothetical protein